MSFNVAISLLYGMNGSKKILKSIVILLFLQMAYETTSQRFHKCNRPGPIGIEWVKEKPKLFLMATVKENV